MGKITDPYRPYRLQIKTDLQSRYPESVYILIRGLGLKSVIFPLAIIVAILLSSCRPKPIDIDVAPAPVKLVIASQIIPNSVMVVGLTRSFSALSPGGNADTIQNNFLDSILVANAIVTVTHGANTDTLFMVTPGIYASINTLLVDYNNYTINAYDPATGQSVTATTQLLPQVRFDSVVPYFKFENGDTLAYVHYEFSDNPASEDYYFAAYYRKSQDTSAFDLNNYFAQGTNELSDFQLLSDIDFDENHHLKMESYLPNVTWTDTIAVTVSHITKGYYEFLDAYKRSSSLFNQLSGEPINYPTNVEGGYGYFATHFPDIRIFDLNNYH